MHVIANQFVYVCRARLRKGTRWEGAFRAMVECPTVAGA